jgi:hypothetical protein
VLMCRRRPRRVTVKSAGEIMEMLEAYDLTGSLRDAAELVGCSHHTVARHVAAREAGGLADRPATRPRLIDAFLPKVEEWMERSNGQIRADVVHDKLLGMSFPGAERTSGGRCARCAGRSRPAGCGCTGPWVTEPGMFSRGQPANGRSDFGVSPLLIG